MAARRGSSLPLARALEAPARGEAVVLDPLPPAPAETRPRYSRRRELCGRTHLPPAVFGAVLRNAQSTSPTRASAVGGVRASSVWVDRASAVPHAGAWEAKGSSSEKADTIIQWPVYVPIYYAHIVHADGTYIARD